MAERRARRLGPLAALLALGVGWGATQPLGKIATSTGHAPFGLIFWQLALCTVILGTISLLRGRGLRVTRPALAFYVVIAIIGTLVPSAAFYTSVERLPAGIMSILISTVPLMAFPLTLVLRMDRFSPARLAGLCLGLLGVALIALPSASLPDPAMAAFLPLAMVGPLFYALEGIYVQKFGMAGMDPVQAMFGASLAGLILCLPVTLATGQWVGLSAGWGRAEAALVLASSVHALLYAGYVALAARAGAVFAAQCSYLVTASGVIWAMVLLGEQLAPTAWAALAVMLSGVALVQPRAGTPVPPHPAAPPA